MNSKVPLQGAELEAYLAKERATKEKEAAQQAVIARNQRMLEADEDESDEDSDSDEEDEVERALDEDQMDTTDGDIATPNSPKLRRKSEKMEDNADWGLDMDDGLTKTLLSFDIYLKGNVSKATSFFKSAGGQTHRFRMFPYVEKKRRVDEFGETIDVGMWLRRGKVFEEEAETDEVKEEKRKQAEEEAKVSLIPCTLKGSARLTVMFYRPQSKSLPRSMSPPPLRSN
jgi:cleavage and polyadenylation specificity factor subunit 2